MERKIAMTALFAALTAALGLLPKLSLASGVPITAQTLGVMLAGAVLGARLGALSVLLFLALTALGLPLLAGGRGGLGVFMGPSVGFLLGWPLGAYVTGLVMERLRVGGVFVTATLAAVLGGIVAIYVPGIIGMAAMLDKPLPEAALLALPFIPGDLIKAICTGLVVNAIWRARPEAVASLR
ncbi:biotin transporter BioY [Oceanicella actignis]|uniref:Biotin transporter n=1 Tax=Oceanicella actignis TaxID=1189325 RepID=A0A1M7SUJ9_9RHOB|nr:biotin transporter BioY [Oceanicella actignis]TYO90669.1 biotin transport system substrate-specific component [Oceanicella actignis]SES71202.1 biotin transport system substrate-specific component [Oceanicella actignis]SHN62078.1 biotin transport system substrate-specific component [Oceanicella actignis]